MASHPHLTGSTTQVQCFKTRLCHFYLQQRCTRGSNCLFAHTDLEVRNPPDLSKTKICVKWKRGTCRHGNQCSYAHGAEDLRPLHGPPLTNKGAMPNSRSVEAAPLPMARDRQRVSRSGDFSPRGLVAPAPSAASTGRMPLPTIVLLASPPKVGPPSHDVEGKVKVEFDTEEVKREEGGESSFHQPSLSKPRLRGKTAMADRHGLPATCSSGSVQLPSKASSISAKESISDPTSSEWPIGEPQPPSQLSTAEQLIDPSGFPVEGNMLSSVKLEKQDGILTSLERKEDSSQSVCPPPRVSDCENNDTTALRVTKDEFVCSVVKMESKSSPKATCYNKSEIRDGEDAVDREDLLSIDAASEHLGTSKANFIDSDLGTEMVKGEMVNEDTNSMFVGADGSRTTPSRFGPKQAHSQRRIRTNKQSKPCLPPPMQLSIRTTYESVGSSMPSLPSSPPPPKVNGSSFSGQSLSPVVLRPRARKISLLGSGPCLAATSLGSPSASASPSVSSSASPSDPRFPSRPRFPSVSRSPRSPSQPRELLANRVKQQNCENNNNNQLLIPGFDNSLYEDTLDAPDEKFKRELNSKRSHRRGRKENEGKVNEEKVNEERGALYPLSLGSSAEIFPSSTSSPPFPPSTLCSAFVLREMGLTPSRTSGRASNFNASSAPLAEATPLDRHDEREGCTTTTTSNVLQHSTTCVPTDYNLDEFHHWAGTRTDDMPPKNFPSHKLEMETCVDFTVKEEVSSCDMERPTNFQSFGRVSGSSNNIESDRTVDCDMAHRTRRTSDRDNNSEIYFYGTRRSVFEVPPELPMEPVSLPHGSSLFFQKSVDNDNVTHQNNDWPWEPPAEHPFFYSRPLSPSECVSPIPMGSPIPSDHPTLPSASPIASTVPLASLDAHDIQPYCNTPWDKPCTSSALFLPPPAVGGPLTVPLSLPTSTTATRSPTTTPAMTTYYDPTISDAAACSPRSSFFSSFSPEPSLYNIAKSPTDSNPSSPKWHPSLASQTVPFSSFAPQFGTAHAHANFGQMHSPYFGTGVGPQVNPQNLWPTIPCWGAPAYAPFMQGMIDCSKYADMTQVENISFLSLIANMRCSAEDLLQAAPLWYED